ncbi:site-specific integrase [uncultured Maribacter sp.]|uniref:tyrosine-type recombinase/integrase n=1 Tax=uncultured Maribacter sp. TaxID=431308 RepID=UPI002638A01D|nr:site-specific integrase [uncultured Maribacter sp.]
MFDLQENLVLKTRSNEVYTIKTSGNIWCIKYGGANYKLNWSKIIVDNELLILLKNYMVYRLLSKSSSTVINSDFRFLKKMSSSNLNYPFEYNKVIFFLSSSGDYNTTYGFKSFYKWALNKGCKDFKNSFYLKIKELKIKRKNSYEAIFLNQDYLSESEEMKIIDSINDLDLINGLSSIYEIQNKVILHLAYELSPRPSQFYTLNVSDFKIFTNKSGKKYYSINLSMSKKRKSLEIEKRKRSISDSLSSKIEKLLSLRDKRNSEDTPTPLFCDIKDKRLSVKDFSQIIIKELKDIGVHKSATDLRHNLAQNLADQGASAEIIAELLGHNSTIPARAYIASTPKIAEIKATALAKNNKYKEIMTMMTTGEIIDESTSDKERSVKGVVNGQYIGGIGSCGLPTNTSCPKNPVYSCYTCVKFHPFKNGNHYSIKKNLQKQAQYFIDIAENGNDLEHNRPVTQLENTIQAVDKVINLINGLNE